MDKSFKHVYQFKISLKGIRPPIWRRIQVPDYCTFWDLHVAIQDAMGWLDLHLHAFEIKNPKKGLPEDIGIPDDDFADDNRKTLAGWKHKISQYFTAENDKALSIYDFGDYWEHELKLEKILPRDRQKDYPNCMGGRRACPPEDCGGLPGYEDMLEVISDPEHDAYESMIEWVGGKFEPGHFKINEVHFENPKSRWDLKFAPEFDGDEDLFTDAGDDVNGFLRVMHRERMHELWEKAKGANPSAYRIFLKLIRFCRNERIPPSGVRICGTRICGTFLSFKVSRKRSRFYNPLAVLLHPFAQPANQPG
jgi:hypothetical protein